MKIVFNPSKLFKSTSRTELRLNKRFLRDVKIGDDNVSIYTVDGDYIRTYKDIEFIEGGHHHARPDLAKLIPNKEIWVEENLTPHDREGVIEHETNEYYKMRFEKWPYDKAHNDSDKKEIAKRRATATKKDSN